MSVEIVEQKTVSFQGAELLGVKATDGKIYVGVRWVCEGIGLSEGQTKSERKRIIEDIVLKRGGRKIVLLTKRSHQEVSCIELDFLPLWLAKISITPTMLEERPEIAQNLVEYQLKAKDALAAAFLPKELQSGVSPQAPSLELQIKQKRAEAMLLNANRKRHETVMKSLREMNLSSVAVQVVGLTSLEELIERKIDYRPEVEKTYTATEIGLEAGVSKNKVGTVANKNGLKTGEYGIMVLDKALHSSKEVEAFRYNERGKERLLELLKEEAQSVKPIEQTLLHI